MHQKSLGTTVLMPVVNK